jgi:TorA maturation chaperone TorD
VTTASPPGSDPQGSGEDQLPAPRWELVRAVGALSALSPAAGRPIGDALGLAEWSPDEHTRLFVLELPPYASIHLGEEGKLGGEGADRVAGLWRALGLQAPADADHLASLFALYAELGHASDVCRTDAARQRLDHARTVLLEEHLRSWLPGYLAAVAADPAGAEWAALVVSTLRSEIEATPGAGVLPSALRDAPPAIDASIGYDELLDALPAPIRVGFVLTHGDLSVAGRAVGAGVRRGERRYALRAMLEQDPRPTLSWLADHARRWAEIHRTQPLGGPAAAWWAERAETTASALDELARADRTQTTPTTVSPLDELGRHDDSRLEMS